MEQVGDTLFGEPKGGKIKQWAVYVDGATVIVEWGRVDGKLQQKRTVCTPKNVGRSNETTPEQQALLEAEAKWNKQHDNKLYRQNKEEARKVGELLPMLAIDGTKKPEKIKYPCHGQPKLDGVRCMVYLEDGEIKAISRQGKFYKLHSSLAKELKELFLWCGYEKLDGELYIHGQKLQSIVSYVRNTDKQGHNAVEFHIFDVPGNSPWSTRAVRLQNLRELVGTCTFVEVVDIVEVLDKESQVTLLDEYLEEGYEGLILRNSCGKYEYNHRSSDLIKVKVMQDSEAKVIGCVEDKNGEGVLTCTWNGVEFDVKMKGDHSSRLFAEQQKLIGLWINFKYQALTQDGIPQFPVGLYVRDCDNEGNPLN